MTRVNDHPQLTLLQHLSITIFRTLVITISLQDGGKLATTLTH